jgi:hypothetical protein|tara:strand:+ start:373 stop:636 length:264 start_codon:yes stop_codon:yes gene_type:complete
MARISEKKMSSQLKIDNAKASAPNVPGDTCPTINYVQEIIDQIAERGDEWGSKQSEVVKELLEYVRDSNFELRNSSKYWYDKYKDAV